MAHHQVQYQSINDGELDMRVYDPGPFANTNPAGHHKQTKSNLPPTALVRPKPRSGYYYADDDDSISAYSDDTTFGPLRETLGRIHAPPPVSNWWERYGPHITDGIFHGLQLLPTLIAYTYILHSGGMKISYTFVISSFIIATLTILTSRIATHAFYVTYNLPLTIYCIILLRGQLGYRLTDILFFTTLSSILLAVILFANGMRFFQEKIPRSLRAGISIGTSCYLIVYALTIVLHYTNGVDNGEKILPDNPSYLGRLAQSTAKINYWAQVSSIVIFIAAVVSYICSFLLKHDHMEDTVQYRDADSLTEPYQVSESENRHLYNDTNAERYNASRRREGQSQGMPSSVLYYLRQYQTAPLIVAFCALFYIFIASMFFPIKNSGLESVYPRRHDPAQGEITRFYFNYFSSLASRFNIFHILHGSLGERWSAFVSITFNIAIVVMFTLFQIIDFINVCELLAHYKHVNRNYIRSIHLKRLNAAAVMEDEENHKRNPNFKEANTSFDMTVHPVQTGPGQDQTMMRLYYEGTPQETPNTSGHFTQLQPSLYSQPRAKKGSEGPLPGIFHDDDFKYDERDDDPPIPQEKDTTRPFLGFKTQTINTIAGRPLSSSLLSPGFSAHGSAILSPTVLHNTDWCNESQCESHAKHPSHPLSVDPSISSSKLPVSIGPPPPSVLINIATDSQQQHQHLFDSGMLFGNPSPTPLFEPYNPQHLAIQPIFESLTDHLDDIDSPASPTALPIRRKLQHHKSTTSRHHFTNKKPTTSATSNLPQTALRQNVSDSVENNDAWSNMEIDTTPDSSQISPHPIDLRLQFTSPIPGQAPPKETRSGFVRPTQLHASSRATHTTSDDSSSSPSSSSSSSWQPLPQHEQQQQHNILPQEELAKTIATGPQSPSLPHAPCLCDDPLYNNPDEFGPFPFTSNDQGMAGVISCSLAFTSFFAFFGLTVRPFPLHSLTKTATTSHERDSPIRRRHASELYYGIDVDELNTAAKNTIRCSSLFLMFVAVLFAKTISQLFMVPIVIAIFLFCIGFDGIRVALQQYHHFEQHHTFYNQYYQRLEQLKTGNGHGTPLHLDSPSSPIVENHQYNLQRPPNLTIDFNRPYQPYNYFLSTIFFAFTLLLCSVGLISQAIAVVAIYLIFRFIGSVISKRGIHHALHCFRGGGVHHHDPEYDAIPSEEHISWNPNIPNQNRFTHGASASNNNNNNANYDKKKKGVKDKEREKNKGKMKTRDRLPDEYSSYQHVDSPLFEEDSASH